MSVSHQVNSDLYSVRLVFIDFFSFPSFKNKYARGVVGISYRPVLWDTLTNRTSFKQNSNLFMVCCWRPAASVFSLTLTVSMSVYCFFTSWSVSPIWCTPLTLNLNNRLPRILCHLLRKLMFALSSTLKAPTTVTSNMSNDWCINNGNKQTLISWHC